MKIPRNIEEIIDELVDQYQEDDRYNRPWIIGFSGGKDSTVLLTLTWLALQKLKEQGKPLTRQVYVVNNDTLVENPVIEEYVTGVLDMISKAAKEQGLPVTVKVTTPALEDTFWSCVIGKGYPSPNNSFRFCTEKMKIKPTSAFITSQVAADGEAIVLVGTRYDESQRRSQSIKRHEIKGHRLSKHPLNANTYTYAPIKSLMLEEVWWIINAIPSPWGFDNQILFKIYADASADDYECPTVVTDDSHRSCGQSRFGCWICTVVKEDKSMTSLIKNGVEWMKPLLEFRNRLSDNRNVSELRCATRRNGQAAVDESGNLIKNADGTYKSTGVNTKTVDARDYFENYYTGPGAQNVLRSDYIKLREINLGYTFKLNPNYFVKYLRLSAYGRNLAVWGPDTKHFDPEMIVTSSGNVQGIEGGATPMVASYGFTVNLKF